jgi:hypothetical protein
VDRYLRVRSKHETGWRPELWLGAGSRGPLDRSGIYRLVVRRGEDCGVRLHPRTGSGIISVIPGWSGAARRAA